MRVQEKTNITLGDLVAAVTDEVKPLSGNKHRVNLLVSYILQDLFLSYRVRFRNGSADRQTRRQKWQAVAWPDATGASRGTSRRQTSFARAQRG